MQREKHQPKRVHRMDRLPTLSRVMACVVFVGCSSDAGTTPPPPSSRVEGVLAEAPSERDIEGFCDVLPAADQRATFEWPAIEGAPPTTDGWLWVNVWATWCRPCVEELARIKAWPARLARDGTDMTLVLLSVDENQALVDRFVADNPAALGSLRFSSSTDSKAFFARHGLDEGAPIPVHLLIGPDHKVRCIRAGAIADEHFEVIRALIREGR